MKHLSPMEQCILVDQGIWHCPQVRINNRNLKINNKKIKKPQTSWDLSMRDIDLQVKMHLDVIWLSHFAKKFFFFLNPQKAKKLKKKKKSTHLGLIFAKHRSTN